jgi:cell wall-associated NlpC family hydrolase
VSSPFEVGDLVFYGGGVPHHVAIIYAPGKVWSHGHEGGPVISAVDYRSDRSQVRRYF